MRALSAEDGTDYTGTELLITWGREHVQPMRFQGMDIGPFEMRLVIKTGESPMEAKQRGMKHLNAMAEEEYQLKLPRFIQRCRETEAGV